MVKRIRATNPSKSCTATAWDLRVHFKNTYETGKAIRGMLLKKAQQFLIDVLDHKRCVPFTKYNGSTGRTAQAKEWGLTKGRWPQKSVKILQSLLQNAASNAESKRLDVEKLVVKKVVVNQAMKGRRRTYRAHGRINAYLSCNCHVKLYLEEKAEDTKGVKKVRPAAKELPGNTKTKTRRAIAKLMRENKFVKPKNSNPKAAK